MDIAAWFASRTVLREDFLQRYGLVGIPLVHVGDDGAFRRYFRLARGTGTQLLMETVPAGAAIATPGHALADFVRIGDWLRANALSAPEIYALDAVQGYMLLEDFGTLSFRGALEAGRAAETVYGLGTDILARLRLLDPSALGLANYYDGPVHLNRRRVIDWFLPAVRRARNPDGLAEDYLKVWDRIEAGLPPCPTCFLHVDYHLENLMWLPERPGLQAGGLLDYQAAMIGPQPYDLINLLDDARRDVPPDLKQAMKARYCAGMNAEGRALFDEWYVILAAQFHCRIIGQFVRLAVRDGKPRYLAHLPRLAHYIHTALEMPRLAPLRDWFEAEGLYFTRVPAIDADRLRPLIRAVAL